MVSMIEDLHWWWWWSWLKICSDDNSGHDLRFALMMMVIVIEGLLWWWWWSHDWRFALMMVVMIEGLLWWWWWSHDWRFALMMMVVTWLKVCSDDDGCHMIEGLLWWWWWSHDWRFALMMMVVTWLKVCSDDYGLLWWWWWSWLKGDDGGGHDLRSAMVDFVIMIYDGAVMTVIMIMGEDLQLMICDHYWWRCRVVA